jgi:ATP/maltotriose-dependent transcriptional regulator MalT
VLARVRGNLAAVLLELDELDAAERVLVAARSDLRARYGDEHDYLVFLANNLAELQAMRGRWDDARTTIDEARRIAERRLGPQSERAGECWTLSGVIELDAGNLATALDHLERAHAILLVSEASPLFVVACEGALAQALVQSGRDDEGRALFREADARVRDGALGPEPAAELRKRAKLAGVALDE